MPGKQRYRRVNRFKKQTAALTPEDRARAVRRACDLAIKNGQTAAGIFSERANSECDGQFARLLFAAYHDTHAVFSVTMQDRSAASWAKENEAERNGISIHSDWRKRACDKAHQATDARELAPGRYTVILEPAAVLDLVGFLFYDFAATALQDKRSCLNGRMGKQVFGENISIVDDVYHPVAAWARLSTEKACRGSRCELVDRGIPRNSGVLAGFRESGEEEAHGSRVHAAERVRRGADEPGFFGRQVFAGRNDWFD